MTTPIERLSGLVVGVVESVAPDEVRVLLELDAPHSTALNTGVPAGFPRLNGYVLIPNEAGATVAYITWIGIERSPYPNRAGIKDFGLIDLPFPLRKMSLSPVGTLTSGVDRPWGRRNTNSPAVWLHFRQLGIRSLIPTSPQVEAIVGAKDDDKRVRIGSSPMASNAAIMVDPDKLFGRHLAVLGNTGSGKSCTVAGLIRWSLEAAEKAIQDADKAGVPNARFIVLDPNGEYAKAFADRGDELRLFRVPPVAEGERPLDVPAWLWSGHEWTAVAHAQPGAQRPLLMQGLRELKAGQTEGVPREAMIRRYLGSYSIRISAMLNTGTQAFAGAARARFECARLLETIASDCSQFAGEALDTASGALAAIAPTTGIVDSRRSGNYFNDFAIADLETVRSALDALAHNASRIWSLQRPSTRMRHNSLTSIFSPNILIGWQPSKEETLRGLSRRSDSEFAECSPISDLVR